jgi:hypothetical protein
MILPLGIWVYNLEEVLGSIPSQALFAILLFLLTNEQNCVFSSPEFHFVFVLVIFFNSNRSKGFGSSQSRKEYMTLDILLYFFTSFTKKTELLT